MVDERGRFHATRAPARDHLANKPTGWHLVLPLGIMAVGAFIILYVAMRAAS